MLDISLVDFLYLYIQSITIITPFGALKQLLKKDYWNIKNNTINLYVKQKQTHRHRK